MGSVKVAITIDSDTLERFDGLVAKKVFPNRSRAIQLAVADAALPVALVNSNGMLSISCNSVLLDAVSWSASIAGRSMQRDLNTPTIFCDVPLTAPQYTTSNYGTPRSLNALCPP